VNLPDCIHQAYPKHMKTTILGIATIIATIAAAIVTSLSGGHIDPLAAAAGVSAGWGLIHASDATPPK